MLRFLFVFGALWLVSSATPAAGFDCGTIEQPLSRAICENDELFGTNFYTELSGLLQSIMDNVIEGDDSIFDGHNRWTKEMEESYASGGKSIEQVKVDFDEHILELRGHPYISRYVEGRPRIHNFDLLPDYNFGFWLHKIDCDPGAYCQAMGMLDIYLPRHKNARQRIELPNLTFSIDDILSDSDDDDCRHKHKIFDLQACKLWLEGRDMSKALLGNLLQIADYNFDGSFDFALRKSTDPSDEGNYGESWVFIYDKKQQEFFYAPALTSLFEGRMVDVDEKKKQLTSSYSYRWLYDGVDYRVENNMPVPLRKHVRSRDGDDIVEAEYIWQDNDWFKIKEKRSSYWGRTE